LINGLGSVGSTFGFVVSQQKFSYNGACALNLGLFFLALPPLAWVVFTQVKETTHGTHLSGDANFDHSWSEDTHQYSTEEGSANIKHGEAVNAVEKNI
jgi:hypothetical protein